MVVFVFFKVNFKFLMIRLYFQKGSYERYIPKGILKKSWMKKHLFEVPAVAAVLFDLNWDDPQWETQKSLCIQKVQEVK